MLIGSMVDNKIQNDLDTMLMSFLDQLIHVLVTSKTCVDLPVITDIVSIIIIRRSINRIQPNHIDSQAFDVIQTGNDSA